MSYGVNIGAFYAFLDASVVARVVVMDSAAVACEKHDVVREMTCRSICASSDQETNVSIDLSCGFTRNDPGVAHDYAAITCFDSYASALYGGDADAWDTGKLTRITVGASP